MIYVFDIDNTICKTSDGKYENSVPVMERIKEVNELYDDGHTIIFNTARGMGRTNNNILLVYEMFFEMTRKQLDDWGVRDDKLFMGKPSGDVYIDDKGIKDDRFFKI